MVWQWEKQYKTTSQVMTWMNKRSHHNKDTWEISNLSQGQRAIGLKWMYREKKNTQGLIKRYKERFMDKSCNQRQGIDYDNVFSVFPHLETIRLINSLAV